MSLSKYKKLERTTHQRQEDIINLTESVYSLINCGEMRNCNVSERVAEMLKLSTSMVRRYCKRDIKDVPTPDKKRKKRPQEKKSVENVDEFTVGAIRRTIYRMYRQGHHITLANLLKEIKDSKSEFCGGRTNIYYLLKNMGFEWKTVDGRRAMLENENVTTQRLIFLRKYMEGKAKGANFIFTDETWIFAKGTVSKSWQDDTIHTAKRRCVGEGKRFIIVHAGGRNGFVTGAGLLFVSGQKKGDYHGEMNGDSFQKWMKKLLECLQEPSIIVMDNAPYHSTHVDKVPNISWKKDDITKWLQEHNVPFSPNALKRELVGLVKVNVPPKWFVIDEMVRHHKHEVLRLPPYHCHYNAIELVWVQCKKHYNSHMGRDKKFGDVAVRAMWSEALEVVTPHRWGKCVDHVEKMIAEYWEREVHKELADIPPLIVALDPELDTSDEDEADDDDSEVLAVPLDEVPGCSNAS